MISAEIRTVMIANQICFNTQKFGTQFTLIKSRTIDEQTWYMYKA